MISVGSCDTGLLPVWTGEERYLASDEFHMTLRVTRWADHMLRCGMKL
jgi:hypothetical protein